MHSIIFATLAQLATGILLFIGFVPPSQIGPGFGRFHAALSLALWLLAAWGHFTPVFFALAVSLALTGIFSGKAAAYYPLLAISVVASFALLAQGENASSAALGQNLPAVLVLGASS